MISPRSIRVANFAYSRQRGGVFAQHPFVFQRNQDATPVLRGGKPRTPTPEVKDVLGNKHRTALLTPELPQAKKQIKDDDIMQAEQKHIARELPSAATMGPDQGLSFYSTQCRARSNVWEWRENGGA
mgnify:CR=1 FL=1